MNVSDNDRQILEVVRKMGGEEGLTGSDIFEHVQTLTKNQIRHGLARLKDIGLVESKTEGRTTRWFLPEVEDDFLARVDKLEKLKTTEVEAHEAQHDRARHIEIPEHLYTVPASENQSSNVREIEVFDESHPGYGRNIKMVDKLQRETRRRMAKKNSAARYARDKSRPGRHRGLERQCGSFRWRMRRVAVVKV